MATAVKLLRYQNRNISPLDNIRSYIYYSGLLLNAFLAYRRTYRNYFSICRHILRREYPVDTILRNGGNVRLYDHSQVSSVALLQGHNDVEYDIANDTVTVPLLPYNSDRKIKVKLHGGISNGDVVNIFLQNYVYHTLPVKGKVVVDIGTNIGDSPIYFALSGAEKIIGLEPYPKNYEIARKNVELNNLSEKITILLAGCSSRIGYTFLDPAYTSGDSRLIDNFKNGIRIPLLTLEDLLKQYNLWHTRSILKMDCEGCEYETILSSADNILQKFSHIQIEYHYGYKNLKERLEDSGFNVSVTKPMIDLSYNPRRIIGYIYAVRK